MPRAIKLVCTPEYRADKRAPAKMDLTNQKLMIAFPLTIEEGIRVRTEMGKRGIHRGQDGL